MGPVSAAVILVFAVLCGVSARDIKNEEIREDTFNWNVIVVTYSEFGRALRIAFRGIIVLELTSFEDTEYEIRYLRVSDGKRLIQSLYQNGELKDCDYGDNAKMVLEFVHEFALKKDLFKRRNVGDVFRFYHARFDHFQTPYAIKGFKSRRKLGEFKDLVKVEHQIRQCRKFAKKVKQAQRRQKHHSVQEIDFSKAYFDTTGEATLNGRVTTNNGAITPKVNFVDKSRVSKAENGGNEFSNKSTSGGSDSKDTSRRKTRSVTSSTFSRDDVKSLPEHHERRKRSFLNKYLMFPGTKWCGRGQIAQEYDELGDDQEADSCCRDHDCCREIIPCFSTKYNYFNFRFHAILHCDCDQRSVLTNVFCVCFSTS